ncbi:MAG: hypothetical protein M3308_05520 [Actinomycetota bacterium]|nr:hypothetical protein [Actinomycetota bacterium]
MTTVRRWSGREAKLLREALRLSVRDFAARLGIGLRTINKWEARQADITPLPHMQEVLDTALAQASDEAKTRFTAATQADVPEHQSAQVPELPRRDAMLPVVVNGRLVLVPINTDTAASSGLSALLDELTTSGDGEPAVGDLGLEWSPTLQGTVAVVGELWKSELERRPVLASTLWVSSAFVGPIREWLLNGQDAFVLHRSVRRVGRGDVDALWAMCGAFAEADHRLGGGYVRSTLVHYVNQVVFPLLQGGYHGTVGRELMAATARLCDLCAFMNFDSGRQGLAQRYFIQSLRLAQAGGNRALGAHILADMSMQAHYLGDAEQALALADAGYSTALNCGSPSTVARCAALQGRAHALRGDRRACVQTCALAEKTLGRAVPADEPPWIRFFTTEQLSAEMLYMASDLDHHDEVQRLAPIVLTSSRGMERRRVLCMTTLAASYLASEGNSCSDVDQACEVLGELLPSLNSLSSARSLDRLNRVRRALAAHAERPSVQELEDRFRFTVAIAHAG